MWKSLLGELNFNVKRDFINITIIFMHQNPTQPMTISLLTITSIYNDKLNFFPPYPTTMYYDKNNYINVGMECFKSKLAHNKQ
jgi:hypothetical protein